MRVRASRSKGGPVSSGPGSVRQRADAARSALFDSAVAPALAAAGARVIGHYVTETQANTYPRLPVREGENVSVWLTSFPNDDAYARAQVRLFASAAWQDAMARWNGGLAGAPEVLKLAPTPRSLLRS